MDPVYACREVGTYGAEGSAGCFPKGLCSFGCNPANHGKLWDAKPEAVA